MKYQKQTRRHFLQGVGGSLMTLPILPSLLTSEAHAQAMATQQFLVLIGTDHGGTGLNKDWFPGAFIDNPTSSAFTSSLLLPAGQNGYPHNIRSARLSNLMTSSLGHDGGNVDNGQQRISFILGSYLNPYLSKINLLVGIDGVMANSGHSHSLTGGARSIFPNSPTWPTMDQFLASSPKFYVDRSAISTPVLQVSHLRYSWLNNGVQSPNTGDRVSSIYNELFSRYQNTNNTQILAEKARRTFLMDRVLEDFRRLVNGTTGYARRISSVDKQRLSQHAEFMFETERKYRSVVNTCSDVTAPAGGSGLSFDPSDYPNIADYNRAWDMLTDLLAAAFSCGATRLANLSGHCEPFLYSGDYHQGIAHQCQIRANQLIHNRSLRWQTENMFGAVVRKLDAIDAGNGQTLLDRGVVIHLHEAGPTTHDMNSMGCVIAGSGNGFFNTGNFVDFRNLQNRAIMNIYDPQNPFLKAGVPLPRLCANIIQAFGHVPADYRRNGRPGYGSDETPPPANPAGQFLYPTEMISSLDTKLPVITR
ncbi:DUF1552 domain-containing protein [bacterium]|nr:DUF1552 domain-containing protein [bacterium]